MSPYREQTRPQTKVECIDSFSDSESAQKQLTFEEILDASGKTLFLSTISEIYQYCFTLHFNTIPGGFGKYQFLILVGLLFAEIPASFVAFSPVFFGKKFSKLCQKSLSVIKRI